MMALRPEDRPQNARELHGELDLAARMLSNAPTIDESDRASTRGAITWPTTRRRLREHRTAVGIALIVTTLAGLALWRWNRDMLSPPVAAEPATVAILPLTNGSGDAKDDAFAVGLTEGVATRLSALNNVRVLSLDESRDAARSGLDAARAARTLGAAFVVEGRIQRNRESLEVDVDIVRHDGHRTPAGHFTGTPAQLFSLHRQVAEGLTAALARQGLAARTSPPEVPPPTTNQEAFADYSQGLLFLERPDVPGNLQHAIRLFQSAVDKDSRFARAYAGLGRTYWALYQETREPQWTGKATAAILDALRIDPDLPEVRLSLAVMYQGMGRLPEAQEELKRVIAAQPSNDDAHRVLAGIHIDRGEWPQAIEEVQKAIALRPNYWRNHSEAGYANFRAGRLADAAKAYQRVTELQPDSARGYHMLGTVQQSAGDLMNALANYEKATGSGRRPAPTRTSARCSSGMVTSPARRTLTQGDRAGAAPAGSARKPRRCPEETRAPQGGPPELPSRDRRGHGAARRQQQGCAKPRPAGAVSGESGRPARRGGRHGKGARREPRRRRRPYNRAVVYALGGRTQEACAALGQALDRGRQRPDYSLRRRIKGTEGMPDVRQDSPTLNLPEERDMAARGITLLAGGSGGAAIVLALGATLGFGEHSDGLISWTWQEPALSAKRRVVKVKKKKWMTWEVENDCDQAQTVRVGNFRTRRKPPSNCSAATEGGATSPFQQDDEARRTVVVDPPEAKKEEGRSS